MQTVCSKEVPWCFSMCYKGDFVCASGGLKSGLGYLGYVSLGVSFDAEKAAWWKGGSFVFGVGNTHGMQPSAQFLGDYLIADNIEAGNHLFLQECYLEQTLGPVVITAGMHDFNAMYAYTDHAALFFNSAFGINSALSADFGVPIFPLLSWGLNVGWKLNGRLQWQIGAYDSPLDFEKNPYNLCCRFSPQKGGLFATEIALRTNEDNNSEGSIKLGTVYHTSKRNTEVHLCAEQQFWKRGERKVSAFLMAAAALEKTFENKLNAALGLHVSGLFSDTGRDLFGIGLTTAFLNHEYRNETVLECSYRYEVNGHIYVQPDIQYIMHPKAARAYVNNALFMALRLGIVF